MEVQKMAINRLDFEDRWSCEIRRNSAVFRGGKVSRRKGGLRVWGKKGNTRTKVRNVIDNGERKTAGRKLKLSGEVK